MGKILPLVPPLVLLAFWELATALRWLPPSLAARPTTVFANALRLLFTEDFELLNHLAFSVARILGAISTGASAGLLVGVALSQVPSWDRLFSPLLRFAAPVPVVVWMPFVVLFFGAGEPYKITLGAIATFLIVQNHVYAGVATIRNDVLELAETYGLTGPQRLHHILLPAIAPMFFAGLRLSMAIGWIVLFFVEFGSATQGSEGLGWFIANARAVGRVEDEYAGVLVLGTAGFASDLLLQLWQQWTLRWSDSPLRTGGLGTSRWLP